MDMEMAEHGLIIIAQGLVFGVLFSAARVQKLRNNFLIA
jgi:hypothetical protein